MTLLFRDENGPRSILPNARQFLSEELNKFKHDVISGTYEFPSSKDSYVKLSRSCWAGIKNITEVTNRLISGRGVQRPRIVWGFDCGIKKLTSVLALHELSRLVEKSLSFSSSGRRMEMISFLGDRFKETRSNIEFCHKMSNIDDLVQHHDIRVMGDYKAQAAIVGTSFLFVSNRSPRKENVCLSISNFHKRGPGPDLDLTWT